MDRTTPIVLVPGLASSARIYAQMIPALWRFGPVMVANHIRDDSMAAIARRILSEAPPRFAVAGHSMGGYIAFEIMRQAPERVAKLALINTQARPDTAEATARRRGLMERASRGELHAIREESFPELVHPSRRNDADILKLVHAQDEDVGVEGYLRQQTAIIARVDSRPTLSAIKCPTLVLTGDADNTIPNALSKEMAEGIPGARLLILDRCGHLPQPEQPEATLRALSQWLGSEVV
ncbi:alpha/beta fold hydrolase [Bradyrhizobium amphicarpaeae]|uniref:Alpha/beta hydrolase n=1 Tax=Bradyrhizobium amphicarpaeae TaxID=1404768 RepID=A0A2U8PNL0_9BRAD|nr:alpha/beta hydrolase [Bradyrhizobium amphicarpaeae]AWL99382.1 alpha/beta hydrolase [Bradyrhizobium amphicarpaeae]